MIKTINNQGQSLIEFLMTITLVISIFFIFFKIAFNAVEGFYIHYATFMASRTYMVVDFNQGDISSSTILAKKKAKDVFKNFAISTWGYDEDKLKFNDYDSGNNILFVGCYYEFEQKMSVTGLMGGSTPLHLKSESFLGKEPNRQECLGQICSRFKKAAGGACGMFSTYFDNGC
jgi:hypothetical protein